MNELFSIIFYWNSFYAFWMWLKSGTAYRILPAAQMSRTTEKPRARERKKEQKRTKYGAHILNDIYRINIFSRSHLITQFIFQKMLVFVVALSCARPSRARHIESHPGPIIVSIQNSFLATSSNMVYQWGSLWLLHFGRLFFIQNNLCQRILFNSCSFTPHTLSLLPHTLSLYRRPFQRLSCGNHFQ